MIEAEAGNGIPMAASGADAPQEEPQRALLDGSTTQLPRECLDCQQGLEVCPPDTPDRVCNNAASGSCRGSQSELWHCERCNVCLCRECYAAKVARSRGSAERAPHSANEAVPTPIGDT